MLLISMRLPLFKHKNEFAFLVRLPWTGMHFFRDDSLWLYGFRFNFFSFYYNRKLFYWLLLLKESLCVTIKLLLISLLCFFFFVAFWFLYLNVGDSPIAYWSCRCFFFKHKPKVRFLCWIQLCYCLSQLY